jgi:two-component system phosphate regulon sensor histidine kinase PhoR
VRLGWAGKVALCAALPVVIGLSAFALVALERLRGLTREAIEAGLRDEAILLAAGFAQQDLEAAGLPERVRALGTKISARITLIDDTGRVVADSDVIDIWHVENHGQRPEVLAALAKGWGTDVRRSRTVDRELLYPAARVPGTRSVARIARDLSGVESALSRGARDFWLVAAAMVLAGGAGSVLLARSLPRPILILKDAAQQIEQGDLQVRVHPRGGDEVARLGHAFNAMTVRLAETVERAQSHAARLATILEGMKEGVVAVDSEEKISFLNGAAREILSLHPTDPFEGRRFYELVRDPSILGLVQMAASRKRPVESEIRHEGPPRRMIAVHAAPVSSDGPGVILVLRDMSRLRRLEQMRSDFVSNVSHELRTPLASIAAGIETLRDPDTRVDPEEGPRFLAMIHRNVERLEALLNDILALSRLESLPESLPMEPVDLASLTRAAVEDLRSRGQRAGLTVTVNAPERRVVLGDYSTLRKIVDNLVLNAITYTSEGGRVRVEVGVENDCATIVVSDTGIGIPKDELDRIFERFYRVDKARSRSAGGPGLGLAIVKHGVGLHGGSVGVVSELARGSTFTVRIPLAPHPGSVGAAGDSKS